MKGRWKMSDQNDTQMDCVDEFARATLELLQELCKSEDTSTGETKSLIVIGKDGQISFAQEYRKLLNSALKTKLENVNFFRKELAKFRSKDDAYRIIIASRIRTSTLEFIEAIGKLDDSTRPHHFRLVEDDERFHEWVVLGPWDASVSSPEDDKITQLVERINYYRKQIQWQAQAIVPIGCVPKGQFFKKNLPNPERAHMPPSLLPRQLSTLSRQRHGALLTGFTTRKMMIA
jgi:hypothetical protein